MSPSTNVFCIVFICFLFFNVLPATADSVSVTGDGRVGGFSLGLDVNSAGFSASMSYSGGPGYINTGTVGVPIKLVWSVDAVSGSQTMVLVGGQPTDILGGGLIFTSTFTLPASALASGSFTQTADVTGNLTALQDLSLGKGYITPGPFLGGLKFTGTGTATFDILNLGNNNYEIVSASTTFSGTGSPVVPEPTSWLLMGTGLAALGFVSHKRAFRLSRLARRP